jgi:hypothetical protein
MSHLFVDPRRAAICRVPAWYPGVKGPSSSDGGGCRYWLRGAARGRSRSCVGEWTRGCRRHVARGELACRRSPTCSWIRSRAVTCCVPVSVCGVVAEVTCGGGAPLVPCAVRAFHRPRRCADEWRVSVGLTWLGGTVRPRARRCSPVLVGVPRVPVVILGTAREPVTGRRSRCPLADRAPPTAVRNHGRGRRKPSTDPSVQAGVACREALHVVDVRWPAAREFSSRSDRCMRGHGAQGDRGR